MNLQRFIKQCLLKSQSHEGQIKIEKMIIWKNRPHIWSYWTDPSELMPGDKVIEGHENLPDGHPLKTNKNAVHTSGVTISPDKLPVLGRDLGRHKKPEKIYEVSMEHKTAREKELFPDVFDTFTPAQIEIFRTLGVVAGDEQAADFMEIWCTEYTTQMYTAAQDYGTYHSKHYGELLYEESEGIQPPDVIDSAIKQTLQNSGNFSDLFTPWTVPISHIPQSIKDHWVETFDGKDSDELKYWMDTQRMEFCTEKSVTCGFMRSCVDRLKLHPEYTKLADEYSELLTQYIQCKEKKDPIMLVYKRKLLDKKFDNINTNLLFTKYSCRDLVVNFDLQGNFMKSFPVLSSKDIEKLRNNDSNTFYNVVLRSIQLVNDDNSYYIHKYHEALDTLDLYQNIKRGAKPSSHIEDNEFKCKISTASQVERHRIEKMVKQSWDKENHGHIQYKIHGIYRIENLPCESEYKKIQKSNLKYKDTTSGGKNCCKDWFYHGTDFFHSKLIFGNTGGYELSPSKVGTMLGTGLYVAGNSSKSAQYIGQSFSQCNVSGPLLLNEASLGNTHELTSEEIDKGEYIKMSEPTLFAPKGVLCDLFDQSSSLWNHEWVLRNPHAALPRYIIHMELI